MSSQALLRILIRVSFFLIFFFSVLISVHAQSTHILRDFSSALVASVRTVNAQCGRHPVYNSAGRRLELKWRCCDSMCAQSCPTLRTPVDCSSPDFSVHGIFQARILEWIAISFSRGSSQSKDWNWVSCVSCNGRQILTIEPPGKPSGFVFWWCVFYCVLVLVAHRHGLGNDSQLPCLLVFLWGIYLL